MGAAALRGASRAELGILDDVTTSSAFAAPCMRSRQNANLFLREPLGCLGPLAGNKVQKMVYSIGPRQRFLGEPMRCPCGRLVGSLDFLRICRRENPPLS